MKWQEDEMLFMSIALEEGWTHKDIANELNRTLVSIHKKASKLNLVSAFKTKKKTTKDYIKQLPIDIVLIDKYVNTKTKIKHKHTCGFVWEVTPHSILNGTRCPKCAGNRKKTTKRYLKQLPSDIILLDQYINAKTKIKHKHSCGFEWLAKPSHILNGRGCPKCAIYTFKDNKPAVTYLIYFPEHNLYKFGISNKYIKRLTQFGSKPEIIFIRWFSSGLEAKELEKQWSKNVDQFKINTGLLKSGNTETFKYKA